MQCQCQRSPHCILAKATYLKKVIHTMKEMFKSSPMFNLHAPFMSSMLALLTIGKSMIQIGSHPANTVNVRTVDWQQKDLKEFVWVVMETVSFLEHEHCNCVNLFPKVQHAMTCYTNLEYVKVHVMMKYIKACIKLLFWMDGKLKMTPTTKLDSLWSYTCILQGVWSQPWEHHALQINGQHYW